MMCCSPRAVTRKVCFEIPGPLQSAPVLSVERQDPLQPAPLKLADHRTIQAPNVFHDCIKSVLASERSNSTGVVRAMDYLVERSDLPAVLRNILDSVSGVRFSLDHEDYIPGYVIARFEINGRARADMYIYAGLYSRKIIEQICEKYCQKLPTRANNYWVFEGSPLEIPGEVINWNRIFRKKPLIAGYSAYNLVAQARVASIPSGPKLFGFSKVTPLFSVIENAVVAQSSAEHVRPAIVKKRSRSLGDRAEAGEASSASRRRSRSWSRQGSSWKPDVPVPEVKIPLIPHPLLLLLRWAINNDPKLAG